MLPLELPYAASFFFCAPFTLHLLTKMEISHRLIYNLTSGKGGRYTVLQVYSDCLPSIFSLLYHQSYYDYYLRSSLSPIIRSVFWMRFSFSLTLRVDRVLLTEFCEENALVILKPPLPTHKRRLYTWTSPDGQYQNQIDYILCSQRW